MFLTLYRRFGSGLQDIEFPTLQKVQADPKSDGGALAGVRGVRLRRWDGPFRVTVVAFSLYPNAAGNTMAPPQPARENPPGAA